MVSVLLITARMDRGGGPQHLHDLVSELYAQGGVSLALAAPRSDEYSQRLLRQFPGLELVDIPRRRLSLSALWRVARLASRFDVVHGHGRGAALYGWLIRLFRRQSRLVHTFHGISKERGGLRNTLLSWLEYRLGINPAVTCIFVSPSEQQDFLDKYGRAALNSEVIPNGVRAALAEPVLDRRGQPLQLVSCTRYDVQKNTALAIAVLAALQVRGLACQLLLLGDGEGMAECRQQARDAGVGDSVQFRGYTATPREVFAQSDIYLSTSRWEGLPIAVLEAMAEGCVPVLSRCSGNNEILDGLSWPAGFGQDDSQGAADCIARLATQDLSPLREESVALVSTHFGLARQIATTRALYFRLAEH